MTAIVRHMYYVMYVYGAFIHTSSAWSTSATCESVSSCPSSGPWPSPRFCSVGLSSCDTPVCMADRVIFCTIHLIAQRTRARCANINRTDRGCNVPCRCDEPNISDPSGDLASSTIPVQGIFTQNIHPRVFLPLTWLQAFQRSNMCTHLSIFI